MTKSELTALVNANGGSECVVAIIMETVWTAIIYADDDHILDLDKDIVTIDGVEYIKQYTIGKDVRPEKRINGDHTVVTFHPMEKIMAVQFIESPEVRRHMDKSDMYDMFNR